MSQVSPTPPRPDEPVRSFGEDAELYDRARPSYPRDGVDWLVGSSRARVLDLGAGTGKLTEVLSAAGHDVLALDPAAGMLAHLARRVTVPYAVARAEQLPLASRSVDVVVCGQSFHWFDHHLALPEIARVLRPGGVLALAWNTYDDSVPWVRRLHRLLEPGSVPGEGSEDAREAALLRTPYFGFVDRRDFRVWTPHHARTLEDLARSSSQVRAMSEADRDEILARVRALYDDYGRGPDGMKLPYLTRCYRAVVRHDELPPEQPPPTRSAPAHQVPQQVPPQVPPEDPGISLIDFR